MAATSNRCCGRHHRVLRRACVRHGRAESSTSCEQSAKKPRKSPLRRRRWATLWSVHAVPDKAGPLVLVVEDEPEIAALMRDFLEADGFRVLLAADAEEAAGALRAGAGLRAARRDAPGRVGLRPLPRDPRRLRGPGPVPERPRTATPTRSAASASAPTTTSSSRRPRRRSSPASRRSCAARARAAARGGFASAGSRSTSPRTRCSSPAGRCG